MSDAENHLIDLETCSAEELIDRLSPRFEKDSDSGMWAPRLTSMVSTVAHALVWLRDNKKMKLSMDVVRSHTQLKKIQELSTSRDLPAAVSESLKKYLWSIPGYVDGSGSQVENVIEQHGYIQMQLTRTLRDQ